MSSYRDTIFYKVNKDDNRHNNTVSDSSNSGYPYTFDGRSFIVINSTGYQTVVFVAGELYPDEK